ncbi:MAG: alpha/beta fold hydrolase [Vicinamibacterales bacterium]|nr:alpha/beta fold hydrolase [Vicinamibacterales bacterium]
MSGCRRRTVAALAAAGLWVAGIGSVAAQGRPVLFPAGDGVPIAAVLYDADVRPAPAVVLVHMLSRSKDDWRGVAEGLQREGITALAIDLRGHGGSGGTAASLPAMTADVRAAVAWLRARPEVRPEAIGMAGASLGANLAMVVAAGQGAEGVRSVALLSPSLEYRGISLSGIMRRYGARPLLLAASTEDPLALRTIRDLAEDTQGIREQWVEPVAGHGTVLLDRAPDLVRTLVDWFRRTLLF